MRDRRPTMKEIVDSLAAQGHVHPSKSGAIAAHVANPPRTDRMPPLLQIFVGAGAWTAGLFFIAALGVADLIGDEPWTLFLWGFLFLGASTVLRRTTSQVFVVQLALALGMAGQAMALVGVGLQFDELFAVAGASVLLTAVLYLIHRDPVFRFTSVLTSGVLLMAACIESDFDHALHGLVLLEAAGAAALFTRRNLRPGLLPLAFGAAVALLVNLGMMVSSDFLVETPNWPSRPILALWLVALIAWAGGGRKAFRSEPVVAAMIAALLAGLLSTPGLSAAVGLLVLGYSRANRTLLGLGLAALPAFLIAFYYDLDIDLGTKSLLLAATGVVLLGARFVLGSRSWAREAAR